MNSAQDACVELSLIAHCDGVSHVFAWLLPVKSDRQNEDV
jgi:hypothetical protein